MIHEILIVLLVVGILWLFSTFPQTIGKISLVVQLAIRKIRSVFN